MRIKLILSMLFIVAVVVSGCVMGASTSTSDVDKTAKGSELKVSASGIGFLHLTAPDAVKLDVAKKLAAKCPGGEVKNVFTVTTMREWFGFVQAYSVEATGICVAAKKTE